MAETMNGNIDQLPELGTKAAAVAAIESLIFRAIGAKDLEPLQLRYWLDAYYQARIAAAGWTEARTPTPPTWNEIRDVLHRQAGWEDGGPPRASAPKEEAERAPQKYDVIKIRAEDLEEARPVMEIIHEEIQRAAKAAGIELRDEAAEPPHQSPAATASPQGEAMKAEGGQEDAAETQQTATPAAKPQRQRPVGWTDGFEAVEIKRSGAAEAAAFKREQFERLQRFLREGVSMQRIVKAAEGNITEDQILGIRECRRVPVAVYRVLEAALDRIETD